MTPRREPVSPAVSTPAAEPFKPKRGLFFALLTIFIVWMIGLVALYVKTVYNKSDIHEKSITTTAAAATQPT